MAARSIVIPLDYRPGTELASFQYLPLLSLPLSPLPHPRTLLFPLSLSLSLFTLFNSKLGLPLHPLLRLRTVSLPPSPVASLSPLSSWWYNLVASQACKRLLAFSNLAAGIAGHDRALSGNLHVSCSLPSPEPAAPLARS